MSTVADVQSGLAAIQAQIATIQSIIASGAAPTAGADFASALDSAKATTDGATGTGEATAATAATSATATGGSLVQNGSTGDEVAQDALKYVGVPYVFGGESTSGMDCSGLVQKVFKDLGVSVPRLVHEQKTIGQKVDSLKDAKPGDLIVLNGGDHIAIYLGNDTVIHAPYAGRTVSVQKAWFTDKDITAIRRVVPSDSTATSTSPQSLATAAQISALEAEAGMSGSSSGSSSLSSVLASLGSSSSTSGSTAQQLLAALQSAGAS